MLPLSQRGNQNATIHYSALAEPRFVGNCEGGTLDMKWIGRQNRRDLNSRYWFYGQFKFGNSLHVTTEEIATA